MKFETFMLRGLFIACITVCMLIMGAMLKTPSSAVQLTGTSKVVSALLTTPASCAVPADGVLCPRVNG
jgi:hypothetical protein